VNRFVMTGLILLGSAVLLGVLAIGGFAYFIGMPLDKESKAAAQVYAKDVAGAWDYSAIQAHGDQELFKAAPQEKMEQYLAWFKDRLGALVSLGDVSGSSYCNLDLKSMSVGVTAHYLLAAKFEKGAGSIQINLIKRDDQWKLLGLNVDSPLLVDLPVSTGGRAGRP